jgi:hypothetical protein
MRGWREKSGLEAGWEWQRIATDTASARGIAMEAATAELWKSKSKRLSAPASSSSTRTAGDPGVRLRKSSQGR